jgi:hypothetical protein
MTAQTLRPRRTGNVQVDQFQRELSQALTTMLGSPFATGKALRNVALTAGTPVTLTHGLGYAPSNVITLMLKGTASAIAVTAITKQTVTVSLGTGGAFVDFWVS